MTTPTERYRVQFYTECADGTHVFCICDFAREAETGKSPIVEDNNTRYLLWIDREEAVRVAAAMNQAEATR